MEKLAQAGEGVGRTPTSIHYIYHHLNVVYAPTERAYIHYPISTVPLYVLCFTRGTLYSKLYTPHHSLIVSLQLISLPLPECECGKVNTKEPILLSASPWNAGRKCTVTTTTSQKKLYKGMECVCRRKVRKAWLQGTHTV